jgi:hypothetical protein
VSVAGIQRHLNKWVPQGLEMFGDERGGGSNIRLGLKDMTNEEALAAYHQELQGEVDTLNAEIVKTRLGERPREEAVRVARAVLETGEKMEGLGPEELLLLPARSFFRRRGLHAFEMRDTRGQEISSEAEYLRQLRRFFPDAYVSGRDFSMYLENLRRSRAGEEIQERTLPFYG